MIRTCIVTPEFGGADPESIGARCAHLAALLNRRLGQEVTVVLTREADALPGDLPVRIVHAGQMEPMFPYPTAHYGQQLLATAQRLYGWLKGQDFAVCYFQDQDAAGYVCMQARRTRQALPSTALVCLVHGRDRRNRPFADLGVDGLLLDHAERYCLEHADAAILCGTLDPDWLHSQGWRLPERWVRSLAAWPQLLAQLCAQQPAAASAPLVSVCTAFYNTSACLEDFCASLARQTWQHFEVVLVDDGSTEPQAQGALQRMAEHYNDGRWRILQQANGGPGVARNAAARHARGEYLLFVDSDDIAEPEMLERLMRAALSAGLDCVSCYLRAFAEGTDPRDNRYEFAFSPFGACLEASLYANCLGGTHFLVRKAVFRALGGFSERPEVGAEDWELLNRLVAAGFTFDVAPEFLLLYRQRPASRSRTTSHARNHFEAIAPVLAALPPWAARALSCAVASVRSDREQIRQLQVRIHDLESTADELRACVDGLRHEVQCLRAEVACRDEKLATLEANRFWQLVRRLQAWRARLGI